MKKCLYGFLVGLVAFMTFGWTYTYDTATPLGSDAPSTIDDSIREVKQAVQERENVDHYWPLTSTAVSDANSGQHRYINFWNSVYTDPNLYITPHSAVAELWFSDANGHTLQLTHHGKGIDANDIHGADSLVRTTGTQAIAGAKTFSAQATFTEPVRVDSNCVDVNDLARKAYVDNRIVVGVGTWAPTIASQAGSGTVSLSLPNGFIAKWGSHSQTTSTVSLTFSEAFPSGCYAVYLGHQDASATNNYVTTKSATGFTVGGGDGDYYWLAIGY